MGTKVGMIFKERRSALMSANLETARVSLQALLPGMVARKAGSIVAIGSRVAARPWEGAHAAAYAGMSRVLRIRFIRFKRYRVFIMRSTIAHRCKSPTAPRRTSAVRRAKMGNGGGTTTRAPDG